MTKTPSIGYEDVIRALKRDGWLVIRQKGSHIRLEKNIKNEKFKLTIPAYRPIKRSTLSHILKQARLTAEEFLLYCKTLIFYCLYKYLSDRRGRCTHRVRSGIVGVPIG